VGVAEDVFDANGWKIKAPDPEHGMWPSCIRNFDAREAGLGFAWLLACVPSTLGAFLFLRGRRRALLLGLAAFATLAMIAQPLAWWPRFTIWLYGAGAPALALALDRLLGKIRLVPVAIATLMGGLVLFEAGYSFVYASTVTWSAGPPTVWPPDAFARALMHEAGDRYLHWGFTGPVTRDALAGQEPVGMSAQGWQSLTILGQLARPRRGRRIVLLDHDIGADDVRLRDMVARSGVRWVVWNNTFPAGALDRTSSRKERMDPPPLTVYDVTQAP
jgi:hypothetical protein